MHPARGGAQDAGDLDAVAGADGVGEIVVAEERQRRGRLPLRDLVGGFLVVYFLGLMVGGGVSGGNWGVCT